MKKIIFRICLALVAVIIIALVVVFFSLDSIVKKGVETMGPEMTKVDVKLGAVAISPVGGKGELSKLFVGNPEGYKTASAIELGNIKVGVKIGSVFSDTVVIDELNLQSPQVTLEGTVPGKNNLSTILDNVKAYGGGDQPKKPEPAAAPAKKSQKKFIVKELVLDGGKINVNVDVKIGGLGRKISTPLSLPSIHLQNLGTAEGGLTADQLVQAILKPLEANAIAAAEKQAANLGADELKSLGKGGTNEVNNLTKGLKGLLH